MIKIDIKIKNNKYLEMELLAAWIWLGPCLLFLGHLKRTVSANNGCELADCRCRGRLGGVGGLSSRGECC
jgi:hypothetical protein